MASMVSLPSIQEGFPDIDFREPPLPGSYPIIRAPSRGAFISVTPPSHAPHASHAQPRHPYISATPSRLPSFNTSLPREGGTHPHVHDSGDRQQDDLTYSQHRLCYSRSISHFALRGTHPAPPPTSFQQQLLHSLQRVEPPPPGTSKDQRNHQHLSLDGTHSFDVLRSEPGTVSLEHIASSKTLQNRSSNAPKPISPIGVANGSAPAFRVALPATNPTSVRTEKISAYPEAMDSSSTLDRRYSAPGDVRPADDTQPHATSHNGPLDSSSMVSFSVSDRSGISKLTVDDSGRAYYQEAVGSIFRVDGRGKKHQCPQCPKRFNRPSSLRIHVNTHTGARPFQCPYPRCGREFNVNSNMRRHYRNHSIAATAEVHPPRHNSGRRPRGYQREHPGRSSRTVFHVSPGNSVQSDPSATSLTDDDSGMEDDFDEDGQASRFGAEDDDQLAEDGNDDEDMANPANLLRTSVTWSLSPSPTADHNRSRSYHDSHFRTAAHPSAVPQHLHSPSSSSRLGSQTYIPSSPAYVKAFKDSTVSTTLRPAFC